jgi:hypothetical protein
MCIVAKNIRVKIKPPAFIVAGGFCVAGFLPAEKVYLHSNKLKWNWLTE